MKKLSGIIVYLVLLAIGRGVSAQSVSFVESQSLGTNRMKSCIEGFIPICESNNTYKIYRTETITFSWSQQWYTFNNTNGSNVLRSKDEVTVTSATAHLACTTVTNATGSITFTHTDYFDSSGSSTVSASMTNSGDWIDTSTPPISVKWWNMGDLYVTGFDDGENPIFAPDYDPDPTLLASPIPATITHPSDNVEILTITGSSTNTDTGDYQTISFTKTKTLENEYTTDELLAKYPDNPNATWSSGGTPSAYIDIAGDQTSVDMSGSRARFGIVAPKKGAILPYQIVSHFDEFTANGYYFSATDITNRYSLPIIGDGKTVRIYPCGKGIQIQSPYASVGSGDCKFFVGGTSTLELLPFESLDDGRDQTNCQACEQCQSDSESPQDMTPQGMPRWHVSEPYLNLWASDMPVDYTTSLGEKIGFTVNYKQHDTRPRTINGSPAFVPVTGWNHNWFSYVHFEGETLFDTNDVAIGSSYTNWTATLYRGGGGEQAFEAGQSPDPLNGDQLLPLTGVDSAVNVYGFRLVHSDGSQDIYSIISSNYPTCYTDSVPAVLDFVDPSPLNNFLCGLQPAQTYPPQTGCGSKPSNWLVPCQDVSWEEYGPVLVANFSPTGFSTNSSSTNVAGVLDVVTNCSTLVSDPIVTNCLALVNAGPSADAVLTYHIDPFGHATQMTYSNSPNGQFFLKTVTDYDGNVTTLTYDANGYISQVSMPYGRTATFSYSAGTNAYLTSVTDAQGMTSTFSYSFDGGVNNSVTGDLNSMTTPYGTTGFTFFDANAGSVSKTNNGVTRSVFITNPDGTHELYAYYKNATNSAPFTYGSSELPDFDGLDDGDTTDGAGAAYNRNSFYWGRSQCAAISTMTNGSGSTMNGLGTNAFLLARMRHWMLESDGSTLSSACSMQQEPSPDGVHPGQRTWFVYPNAGVPWVLLDGSLQEPDYIVRLQPDATTWYQSFSGRDNFGNPGTVATHYIAPDSSAATSTEYYSYPTITYSVDAGAGPVYWYASRFTGYNGPNGSVSYSFDYVPMTNSTGGYPVAYPNYSIVYVTKNDRTTTLFFNSKEQVSGGVLPNGLTVTNLFGVDGFLSKSIALEVPATNTYTFSHGLPATWTDPNGLTKTFTWDNLERLTNVAYPDGTAVVSTYTNLNLASQKDRLNHSWTAHYDSMGRRTSFTDLNGNTTLFSYCGCGSLESITDPQTNTLVYVRDYANRITSATYNSAFIRNFTRDSLGRITHETNNATQSFTYSYDNLDRVLQASSPQGTLFAATYDDYNLPVIVQNAEGILVTNQWDDSGRHLQYQFYANGMSHNWGYTYGLLSSENDGVHTTTYGRDKAGQITSVEDGNLNYTYFGYSPAGQLTKMTNANNAVTSWNYDLYGRMLKKTDANNVLVETNDYDAGGRLTKHWTPAKGLTQYGYDNNGNPLTVAYSSGPGVTATYDTLNRIATMSDAVGRSAFSYQNFGPFWGALASEDGPWAADTMSRAYYANGLPNTYSLDGGWSGSYGYDAMLRLHTLSSPAGTFTYNYANATGRQIASLGLPGGNSIAYGYDPAGLLTSTALKNSGNTVLDSYGYTYDAVGWRTNVLRADGTHVGYGYDNIGQLTSATGFESGGTPRYNENFGYTYDLAGNLSQRINDTLSQTFTVDPANELTNVLRTTSVMTVAGDLTNTPTSLSINGKTASIYGDKTFAATNVALVNGLNTFTNILTISGSSYTNQLIKNLPTSANLSYDLNGNMTSDGLHGYEYDCANQLTRITQTNKLKSEFVYDGFGRRRIRREYAWTGQWIPTSETHYVYDGMLVIQERDGSNATKVTYTRGLDLSGDDQSAGGIGGLLARTDANGSAFYHADGNGNVTAMVNSSGTVAAKYIYDSYGNILAKTGPLADANLYRFSSKEVHIPSGSYYYGFRFYDPNLQRWVNRDPLGEWGGINLYGFVGNTPINGLDSDGLFWKEFWKKIGDWFYETGYGHPGAPNPDMAGHLIAVDPDGGGIDPHNNPLKGAISEGTGIAGDQLTDYLAAEGAGRIIGGVCKIGAPKLTQFGYEGGLAWRNAAKLLDRGGTVEHIGGKIPTKEEALNLLEKIGAKIKRIEEAHLPPNPHQYPHINYDTASGVSGTVRIDGI